MCMGMRLTEIGERRYINSGRKKGYLQVWKVVASWRKRYEAQIFTKIYKNGLNHARQGAKIIRPNMFIHAFRDRKSAERWMGWGNGYLSVVECLVHPDWVITAGASRWGRRLKTMTTTAIVMPEYPKRRAVVKDFKAIMAKKPRVRKVGGTKK